MSKPSPPQIDGSTVVYCTPGRCIYCSSDVDLGREHIIALALGGTFIFRKASCAVCAKIINEEFEGPILQIMFGTVRAKLDLHNRRHRGGQRKRSETRSIIYGRATDDGARFEDTHREEVPNFVLPLVVPGLNLDPPRILFGEKPSDALNGALWVRHDHERMKEFLNDGEGYRVASINPLLFCRMLAKIAHGFATAEIGLGNFEPLLPDLILGRSQTPCYWVGGPGFVPKPENDGGHRLRLDVLRSPFTGIKYHSVNIRLFCPYGAPEYDVVVGECC